MASSASALTRLESTEHAPKIHTPCLQIDQLVDGIVRYPVVSFLDVHIGYHKIFMDLEDSLKMPFTIGKVIYYYIRMPLSLKNARASFHWAMTKVFADQIGRNLEAYA